MYQFHYSFDQKKKSQQTQKITGKFCNAPIPKDHKFYKEERTYQKDGCTITEHIAADGAIDGVEDCSKKK